MKTLIDQNKHFERSQAYFLNWIVRAVNCLTLLFMAMILVACDSEEDDDLSRYIRQVEARKARPIAPIPTFLPLERFAYPENEKRRSPFKPKETVNTNDQFAPNTKRPKQALEFFPLDALKFVGILKQGSITWGLISEPNGEVTRVKIGNYMGKNFGRIISINETTLKLEETTQSSGKWEKKITTFNLNTGD